MTIPLTIIINLVLSVAILSGILAMLLRAIATQRRDDHVASVVRIRGNGEPSNRLAAGSQSSSAHKAAA